MEREIIKVPWLSALGWEEAKVYLSSVVPNPGSSDTSRLKIIRIIKVTMDV